MRTTISKFDPRIMWVYNPTNAGDEPTGYYVINSGVIEGPYDRILDAKVCACWNDALDQNEREAKLDEVERHMLEDCIRNAVDDEFEGRCQSIACDGHITTPNESWCDCCLDEMGRPPARPPIHGLVDIVMMTLVDAKPMSTGERARFDGLRAKYLS